MDAREDLRACRYFSELTDEALDSLAAVLDKRIIDPHINNGTIIKAFDKNDRSIYFLTSGAVNIVSQDKLGKSVHYGVQVTAPAIFDGKAETPDRRYRAIHGRLVVTTPPEGRRIQQLWTTREFGGDFILKLEFRATPNADSGVFIRQPQLQCRDYLLAGPYKDLKSFRQGDWNELVVEVRGGTARATCNGELLTANLAVPASGPLGLEGDRGQMEYRRIRIKPL